MTKVHRHHLNTLFVCFTLHPTLSLQWDKSVKISIDSRSDTSLPAPLTGEE